MEKNKAIAKPADERRRRRLNVLALMEDSGPYSIPINDLCEKWNCSRPTIYKDISYWIKKLDFSKIDEEGKRILYTIRQNLRISEQLRKRGKDKDRLKAIELTNKSAELLARIMEQFGFKEKVAEKLDLGEGLKIIIERADDEDSKVETESETTDGSEVSKG